MDTNGIRYALGLFDTPPRGDGKTCLDIQTVSGGDLKVLASIPSGGGTSSLAVVNAHGTVYSFGLPTPGLPGYAGLASKIEDRNGNVVTISNSGNGVFAETDTAGRTVLSSSGFGATGNTVTVSGLAAPYQLAWESVTYNFNPQTVVLLASSACVPLTQTGSLSVIETITIPNGKQYQFGGWRIERRAGWCTLGALR